MKTVLSSEAMRRSDAAACASLGSRELMLRAGKAIASAALGRGWGRPGDRAAVVCGGGNNGGDGYVIAAELVRAGIGTDIYRASERFSEDGGYYYRAARAAGAADLPVGGLAAAPERGYAVIFDCICGTGFSGVLRGAAADAAAALRAARGRNLPRDPSRVTRVVSADINSGLSSDSGLGEGCVVSDLTVAVGAFKPGHFLGRAKDVMSEKIAVDIGIDPVGAGGIYSLVEPADVSAAIPRRDNYSHKGTWGYAAIIGGSMRYGGAVRLAAAASAAMRSGAGVVRIGAPASLCPLILPQILEATLQPLPDKDGVLEYSPSDVDKLTLGTKSVTFGMGTEQSEGSGKTLLRILENYPGTLVADAGGLNILAEEIHNRGDADFIKRSACRSVILTPHPGEFSRLSGMSIASVEADPCGAAIGLAEKLGEKAVVLLKGPSTVVAGGGRAFIVDTGCPGMGTAGSGDVLSGVLSALSCYIPDPVAAAYSAAWIAGKAGEAAEEKFGAVSMIASDTVAELPGVVKDLCN